jgi:aerobic-type carbon monoxide dehydrogenase small subunit (CoxS/CutS family)
MDMNELNKKEEDVKISFMLNGRIITRKIPASMLLIDLIRDDLGLTGTKPGCLEGECGACTVLINDAAVNSCMYLAINIDGKNLTTIEGLEHDLQMDPVQEAMIQHGAVQCGFCSSGMVMSIKSLQYKYRTQGYNPTLAEIKKGLEGNLCRCTGYVKIVEAAVEVVSGQSSVVRS